MATVIKKKNKMSKPAAFSKTIRGGDVEALLFENPKGKPYLYVRQHTEELYRFLLETFHEGAVSVSKDGSIIYCNTMFSNLIKRPRNKIIGTLISEYVPPNQVNTLNYFLKTIETGSGKHNFNLVLSDGSQKNVYFSCQPIQSKSKSGISIIVIDMTKYKLAEKKRKKVLLHLEKLNKELQKANCAKNLFLANMSHELRSPLHCIIGFADLIYNNRMGILPADCKDSLSEIRFGAYHLLYIINTILDLSKIESGHMENHSMPINISQLTTEVIKNMNPLLTEKNILCNVTIDKAMDSYPIITDPDKLKQILYNYLSNAIKFSDSKAKINIRLYPKNKKYFRLEVKDEGIGIKKSDMDKLFTLFQQLQMERTKSYQGIGLGLALCSRLAKGLGGKVGVTSQVGKGSTFFVTLPFQSTKRTYVS